MNTQEWHPGTLLELSGYFWKTCTLHAAVKLDVFTAVGDQAFTAKKLASKLNVDNNGLERLLNALTAMTLLSKSGNKFSNTPAGKNFLSKTGDQYLGHIIMHHHHLVESWTHLDQAVKTGMPVRNRASFSDEEWRESFLMGMFNLAMAIAPRLVPLIDLGGRRHLLDLGGGPGTYAIHFCMKNPQLKASVFDLPTTRPFAEKTIKKFDLSDRIDFMDGNYLEDRISGRFDVAWLSHILHGEGPEDCLEILKKTVAVLEPEGLIVIHDFLLNNSMDGPLFPALFSLNMLLGTTSGQSYSENQVADMLSRAGVKDIRRIPFESPNDSGIMMGVV
jgi:predicted O-methyltransferase YrrM